MDLHIFKVKELNTFIENGEYNEQINKKKNKN